MPSTSPPARIPPTARVEAGIEPPRHGFLSARHRILRAILAGIVVAAAALVGAVAVPQAAAAAEFGPGFQEPGKPLNHLGGYRTADGSIAYCIEPGHPSPIGGVTADSGFSEQVNGLDPAAMLQLDVVLARHGDTADNRTAAAVAMTVWSIADAGGYAAAGGDERALRRAPEGEREAIRILANQFRLESTEYGIVVPHAELRLTIDEHDEREGILEVELYPDTAVATVTLEGAEFAAADAADAPDAAHAFRPDPSIRSVSDGDEIEIVTAPRADTEPFRVTASTDDITVTGMPSGTVHVYSTLYAQTLVATGAPTSAVASATATDIRDRLVPALSTTAQPSAVAGGTVRDVALVSGLPSAGATLRFEGFLQPVGATTPVCTDDTVVYRSAEGIRVATDGEMPSEAFPVRADHVGTVFWVATVTTAAGVVLGRGECGDPAETTVISSPPRLPVVSG